MKRSRGTSIDATAVVTSALTPFRLSRDTNEQFVVDTISPLLRQLVDLSNNAVSGLKEDAETLSLRHAKYGFAELSLFFLPRPRFFFSRHSHASLACCQVSGNVHWDMRADDIRLHHFWRERPVGIGASDRNVHRACECVRAQRGRHGVCRERECCPGRRVRGLVSERRRTSPSGGGATPHHGKVRRRDSPVCARVSSHCLFSLFAIPVPVLPFLSQGHREVVSVELRRGEDWSTRAPLEVSAVPGVQFPHAPYTPMHLPLHYAALSGDVTAALRLLDKMPSDGVRTRDEWGTEAAALALFHGHRVLYALLTWRSLHWPALAVCQLLRARMELESNLIDAEMFWSVRESVHEFVHDALHDIRYRPIKYQTSCVAHSDRGPLAIMLLPEIPYTEHESAAPVRASSTSVHRRGSLDVLLQAIEVISE